MILYVGNINSPFQQQLNVHHFCLNPNPHRKAYLPRRQNVKVLLDSGAFSDVRRDRLSFDEALTRQLEYEAKNGFISERIVSYDLLIDEQLDGNRQVKSRWGAKKGWKAVETTIAAAEFLASFRSLLAPRQLVLSCQGVTCEQYVHCTDEILKIAALEDCIGLGGWCIVGQQRHLSRLFWHTMEAILPRIAEKHRYIHLFGVSYVSLMYQFARYCRSLGLIASTDTSRFYFELSRGMCFHPNEGKSYRVDFNGHNLATDKELVRQNVEGAYQFFFEIERWSPPQMSLFEV